MVVLTLSNKPIRPKRTAIIDIISGGGSSVNLRLNPDDGAFVLTSFIIDQGWEEEERESCCPTQPNL